MIRNRIFPFILFTLCLIAASETGAQTKVGTVDMDRIFKEYAKTKDAEAKINEAKNVAKKEYDERAETYKKALDEINRLNQQMEAPALSAEARTAKGKDRDEKIASIKNMEREIDEFRQTRERQLQQQMVRMRDGIVKEITDVVLERVKSNNMDLVFDKSGPSLNGFSPILFSHESADFTAEVMTALNKVERSSAAGAAIATPSSAKATKP